MPVEIDESPWQLTESQQQACEAFLNLADGIGQALAAEHLKGFNATISHLQSAIPGLLREFAVPHAWNGYAQRLGAGGRWPAARNLEQARERFLSFSSNTVEFARSLKKSHPEYASLKIYQCPMAPKPGLWLQTKGPLRNPFFGAEMLTCGKEVIP